MLDLLLAGVGIVIILQLYLIYRQRAFHKLMVQPLPSAVTSRGVVPLNLKDRSEYFKQQRDKMPPGSPRWQQYDVAMKRAAG